MDNNEFLLRCDRLVSNYVMEHLDKSDDIPEYDIYPVWLCKTLKNNKALFSTSLPDGMYYEITYNGETKETYFDAYKKFENRVFHED